MTPYQFFKAHAGASYDPAAETIAEGRQRCAHALARAERWACVTGCSYRWELDIVTNADYEDTACPYRLWCVLMYDAGGEVIGSLGAIDFGENGEPWGDDYRRVVEAELALEVIP